MSKIFQIVLAVLGLITLSLGFIGLINNLKNPEPKEEKIVEIKYEENGKVFELLTKEDEFSLSSLTTDLEKETAIEGHGKLKIVYKRTPTAHRINISINNQEIYTKNDEILYKAYIFHDSIVLYLNKLKNNSYGKMLIIQKGIIVNELENIVYNGNIYYFSLKEEPLNITNDAITFRATSIENGMFHTLTNSYEACRAVDEEIYEANFSIKYINKIITSPSMDETNRKTIKEYKIEQAC